MGKDSSIATIPTVKKSILKVSKEKNNRYSDTIAVEAPLEIKLVFTEKGQTQIYPLVVTMRTPTPNTDKLLALGYLFHEGIIGKATDVVGWQQIGNTLRVVLAEHIPFVAFKDHQRRTIAHASCGICGKPSLESLEKVSCHFPLPDVPKISVTLIYDLQNQLLKEQTYFAQTGGMHAAALFQPNGELLTFQEDIGRHNALDKLIGWALLKERVPLRNYLLFLSGRISFELVQKASLAGVPIIVAVGAPSSLAIDLAITDGITLIGFVKKDRFNIYCGAERITFS